MEKKSGVQKLQEFLGEKFPKLEDKEIEKIAENLLGIGVFIVRQKVSSSTKQTKPSEGVLRKVKKEPP